MRGEDDLLYSASLPCIGKLVVVSLFIIFGVYVVEHKGAIFVCGLGIKYVVEMLHMPFDSMPTFFHDAGP
jgi:hypothetical protein